LPLSVDLSLLTKFERELDPQYPERSRIPATVLGYGEISTVFAIQAEGLQDLAFKRLPLFNTHAEITQYRAAYDEYNRLLEEIGLHLPEHGDACIENSSGRPVFYIVQKQLDGATICHHMLQGLPTEAVLVLIRRILQELRRVWEFNGKQDRVRVAIDGQISNWAVVGFDPQTPRLEDAPLLYFDTSTPLFQIQGVEQLDTELFLRSAPSFLVWVLRLLFLKDVVERYYDFHRVAVDLVANFYKEQRSDLIPQVVRVVNEFFVGEGAGLGVKPISEQEVRDYYREDALIWSLYFSMRKFDRFLRLGLLHKEYPYILPEKILR
jgi:hypothetical protein